ncbi:accessory gene regulator B family protein [Paenibacillus sp. FSL H7-0331]|uniref:accessory gene regulator B family protein n=1 Tax=Paenibacillus sp. FSL H7-0331 TaxID=1920421 RepID=UPI0035570566
MAESVVRNNRRSDVKLEHIEYMIHVSLNILLVGVTSLIISLFLNTTTELLIFTPFFLLLRFISGSAWHFRNDLVCYIFSSLVISIIPTIDFLTANYISFMNIFSLIVLLILSPISNNEKINSKKKLIFKMIGVLFVAINFLYIKNDIVSVSFFVQCVSMVSIKRR